MSFVEDTYQPDISRAAFPRGMQRPAPVDPVMEQIRAQMSGMQPQATGAPTNIVPMQQMQAAAQAHVLRRNMNARPAHVSQLMQQMQSDPAVMDAVLRGTQQDAPQLRGAQPQDQMAPPMRGTLPPDAGPQLRGTYDGNVQQPQAIQSAIPSAPGQADSETAEGVSSSPAEEGAEAGGTNPAYDYSQLDMGGASQGMDPALAAALGIGGAGAAGAGAAMYMNRRDRMRGSGDFVNAPMGDSATEINPREQMRQSNPSVMEAIEGPAARPQLEAPRQQLRGPIPQTDGSGRAAAQDYVNQQRARQAPNVVVTPPPTDLTKGPNVRPESAPAPAVNTTQPAAAQPPQKDLVAKIDDTVMDKPGQPAPKSTRPRRVAGGLSSPTPDPLGKPPPNIKRATAPTAAASGNAMNVKQPRNPKKPISYDAGMGAETAEPYDVTQAPKNNAWKKDPRWANDLEANAVERAIFNEQNVPKKRTATAAQTEPTTAKPRAAKAEAPAKAPTVKRSKTTADDVSKKMRAGGKNTAKPAEEPIVRTLDQSAALSRDPAHSAKIRADRAARAPQVLPDQTVAQKADKVAAESAPKPKPTKAAPTRLDVNTQGGPASAGTKMNAKLAKDILAGNTDLKGEELAAAKSRARQFQALAAEAESKPTKVTRGPDGTVAPVRFPQTESPAVMDAVMGTHPLHTPPRGGNEETLKLMQAILRRGKQ